MGNKMITKADIILAVVLLILGLGSPFLLRADSDTESRVVITVDGAEVGSYALSEDRVLALTEEGLKDLGKKNVHALPKGEEDEDEEILNLIVIEDSSVKVTEATCKGGDCIKMGTIRREGEVIACLPHKMLITITGGGESPDVVIN